VLRGLVTLPIASVQANPPKHGFFMEITMLGYEQAKRTFVYNRETGKLYWSASRPRSDFATSIGWKIFRKRNGGKELSCLDNRGYIRFGITVLGERQRLYRAHRVIWLLEHGEWPEEIDHINGIRHDNRLENLRNVSHKVNLKNMSMRKNNTSGVVGVHQEKRYGRWAAYISVDKRIRHLGNFKDKQDAIAARKAAETKYGFHNGHGKKSRYAVVDAP